MLDCSVVGHYVKQAPFQAVAIHRFCVGFEQIVDGALNFIDNVSFPFRGPFQVIQVDVGQFDARIGSLRTVRFQKLYRSPQLANCRYRLIHFQLGQGQPIVSVAVFQVLL